MQKNKGKLKKKQSWHERAAVGGTFATVSMISGMIPFDGEISKFCQLINSMGFAGFCLVCAPAVIGIGVYRIHRRFEIADDDGEAEPEPEERLPQYEFRNPESVRRREPAPPLPPKPRFRDERTPEVIKFVLGQGHAAKTAIKNRFGVGNEVADRLLNELKELGVIGERLKPNAPYPLAMSVEDFQKLLA
jgi:hypothetical protein